MSRLFVGIIVIIIVIVAIMYGLRRYNSPSPAQSPAIPGSVIQTPSPQPNGQQSEPQTQPLTVTLSSQSNSGESGSAMLIPQGDKTKVTLNLSGAPKDVPQPAHIHDGSCAVLGDVRYTLVSPKNGTSETILDVPLSKIISELPLAINVHKSQSELPVYYACGDIIMPRNQNGVSSPDGSNPGSSGQPSQLEGPQQNAPPNNSGGY